MYIGEFKLNWVSLLASAIGMALGSAISHYTMSLFGPEMIREFGWSKADFALIGTVPFFTLVLIPVAGRFTDRFGTRVAAIVGFTALPLGFLAYTVMSGSLIEFFAIYLVQHVFAILTTTMVFARVIVERFDKARGLALSVLMTGPPLVGAVIVPILGGLMRTEGWRSGYVLLAALTATGGVIAVSLMGRGVRREAPPKDRSLSRLEFWTILTNPAFLLVIGGMILVNLPQVFASSQLKLVVMENGLDDRMATWMVSLYPTGVIIGRFLSGLALDRLPAHLVAIAALGLPAIGFVVLASGTTEFWIVAGAVAIVGLAQGAEGDIGAYLVSRRFDMKNYSLMLSMVTASIGLGSAIGSALLSFTLRTSGDYNSFLIVSAFATILGALLFFATGSERLATVRPA